MLAALARTATLPCAPWGTGPSGECLAGPHASLPCSPGIQPGCARRLACGPARHSRTADFS